MIELKVRKFGNSLGVVLPKEVIQRLGTAEGERIFLNEGPQGVFQLTPYEGELHKQMEIAREGMVRYRKALRVLAK